MGYEAETRQAELTTRLLVAGQQHVLQFHDQLGPAEKLAFETQLLSLDWKLIGKLIETIVRKPSHFTLPPDVQPASYFPHEPATAADEAKYDAALARGEQLLRQGRIAAFVVAGGQGTRLGWEGPKGTFPATPIKKKPLFQCFAEYLLALGARYGKPVPFYIMTSPLNDAATRAFWKDNNFFGMNPHDVMFFPQDSLPAIDFDGRVLLERKDSLALSPNGHGGSLLALYKSAAIDDMARRGVTQISYFQVDNPIVRCIDPLFIGLHDLEGAQMSSKMLPKAFGKEKLGNFCIIDGKLTVIEYSDLPDELAEQRLDNGQLRFRAGSIALHAIRRDFVELVNAQGFALPYHRAEKKVPYIDLTTGQLMKPEKPNAVKMETFVFDALPLTDHSIIFEADRLDEFGPIKQPEGIDSVVSSHETTTRRNAMWLERAGIKVPQKADGTADCVIEIAPSFALYVADVVAKKDQVPEITPGAAIYLA